MEAPFRFTVIPLAAEAITVGTTWLLREIEVAALAVEDATFQTGPGCGNATLTIKQGKTITQGKKCQRSVACACPAATCPVKALRASVQKLSGAKQARKLDQ